MLSHSIFKYQLLIHYFSNMNELGFKITEDTRPDDLYSKAREICKNKESTQIEKQKAFEMFRIAAEKGNTDSMCCLSCSYNNGYGCEKDMSSSVYWAMKAADMGDLRGEYIVGLYLYEGTVVRQNHSEAVKWFSKAAEKGHSRAQFYLGCCFYYGQGVNIDFTLAVKWFSKAAEQGNSGAQFFLGLCYQLGRGVNKDSTLALRWFSKAAGQGNANAQCCLGICYYLGQGVDKDFTLAAKWFTKALELGDSRARDYLNRINTNLNNSLKRNNQSETRKEIEELVDYFRSMNFRNSSDLSNYIMKHKLGDKFKNISGYVDFENDGEVWTLDGGFSPKYYAEICEKLGLDNKHTRAHVIGFESFKDKGVQD